MLTLTRVLIRLLLLLMVSATGPSCSSAIKDFDLKNKPSSTTLVTSWTVSEGIEGPESVYFDPVSQYVFVSNVAGRPDHKDGVGWISKLDTHGNIVSVKWVDGLHAPKGLRAHAGKLWVTNIDEVLTIDISTATIERRIPIRGAKFLNDIAISESGEVFVSDTVDSSIHRIKNGKVVTLVKGGKFEHPNGLLWEEDDKLLIAAWGRNLKPDWSTETDGHLFELDLRSKRLLKRTPKPLGHLDGLESDGRGGWFVSDWILGKIYHVTADGVATEIASGIARAADIGFIPSTRALLVPAMGGNQVYSLSAP